MSARSASGNCEFPATIEAKLDAELLWRDGTLSAVLTALRARVGLGPFQCPRQDWVLWS